VYAALILTTNKSPLEELNSLLKDNEKILFQNIFMHCIIRVWHILRGYRCAGYQFS